MAGAVFSDVEGTLIKGSLPRTFVRTAHQVGLISKWELYQAAGLSLLAKPMPARINLYLQYLALRRLLKGRSQLQVGLAIEASTLKLMKAFKTTSLERLKGHQAEGLPIILISGALQEAISDLAGRLGVRGEGTRVEVREGVYTGKSAGAVTQGEGKAARVREIAQEMGLNLTECIGYGDTMADVPFLALLGRAIVVDPSPKLHQEAERRGWEILLTESTAPNQTQTEKAVIS